MTRRFLRIAIVLGLITAVGPFAIDMYLPALPSIGGSLNASASSVQMSLTAFFVTLGICQLVYGPLADMVGRKRPIYAGLAIFTIGSIGCAFAPTIESLIVFRVIQAVGACAGMVIPRAIVRDMHTGHEATQLISMLMLVVSVSPILAPLTGSLIIGVFGWRGVFWALTIAAAIASVLAVWQLHETREAHHRASSTWGGAFAAYGKLLRDPYFVGLTLTGAFGISAFFVYLSNASFVIVNHYGLTPTMFSLCFALNAAAFFGVTQLTAHMSRRYGLPRVIRVAVTGFAAAMVVLALLFVGGVDNLVVMVVFLFIGYGFLGLVLPTAAVLSLDHHGAIAGTASALMGAMQFVVGAIVMALSGLVADGTAKPMVVCIAATALTTFVIAQFTLRREAAGAAVAESK
ncbi:multidrug effflux MFS transporter [Pararobbsia silviterrae]|uniref:Bcr/CflA family efflux transporter n=1 Tax=Pararobbsia silviterrae TaxID=1792498 RepID=A0A494XZ92_9BURK|nr:multidrug effflux MFS transporter [Pararobbsia silviterrae]RKP55837.1 Bcr/CflA family efflux MFS transporter [Pararobbsia silviterrae]